MCTIVRPHFLIHEREAELICISFRLVFYSVSVGLQQSDAHIADLCGR